MSASFESTREHGSRAVYNLAWPLTLKSMMLFGVVVIDALLVAPLGESALAAMGLASTLGGLLLGTLIGVSNATQISLSRSYGADDPLGTKTALYCGLTLNLAVAIIGAILVLSAGGRIIDLFAHTASIAADAKAYLFVFVGVLFAEAFATTLTNYCNGSGNTRRPLASYLVSLPINVLISAALIYGLAGFPELGVLGAAIGSLIAAIARALYLGVLTSRENGLLLHVQGWSGGNFPTALRRHFLFSLPIAATFVSATAAGSVCGLIYARLSINEFAAITIILPWIQFVGAIGMGWAQATGILVGQRLGGSVPNTSLDQFLREAWQGAIVAAGIVAAIYAAVCLGATAMYSNLNLETRMALLSFLPVLVLLPFPKGSNAMCGHTLRAGGDTVYVMNIFVVSQWLVRVPATALLVLVMDVHVVWVVAMLALEELVKFPAFHARFQKGLWKAGTGLVT